MKRVSLIGAAISALLFAGASHAIPFSITSQLVGDPRSDNPDNIFIDVTINGDTESNTVNWLVDLNSLLHPQARLHEFSFNVLGLVTLPFNATPAGWYFLPNDNLQGSGGMNFRWSANDAPGNGNNVTNVTSLTFSLTNLLRNFAVADFLDAGVDCSNDAALGCAQLGAHVGGLGTRGGLSGIALGDYAYTPPPPPPPPTNVPEPATLGLLGLGLLGVGFARRKRSV